MSTLRATVRDLRRVSRAAVLRPLFLDGPQNRVGLAQLTGLSSASVTNVIGDLLAEELVVEVGTEESDVDGIDMRLKPGADSIETAKVVTAILNSTHHNIPDFSVIIPADLLAQQQRTQTIFTYVMVAIAAISLLVGGIGIMNIVLATVMERTREIGVRRATGARRNDIVRQFLTESVLISVAGGVLGIAFGYLLSWLIARTAEWRTIVTSSSIVIAFGVSVAVGVIFGIYPAVKASRINPIDALRYE